MVDCRLTDDCIKQENFDIVLPLASESIRSRSEYFYSVFTFLVTFMCFMFTGVNPGGGGDGGIHPPPHFLGGGWHVQISPPPHFLKIR